VINDEGVSGISTCFAERDGGKRLPIGAAATIFTSLTQTTAYTRLPV
jgi:hypothetical protein